MSALLTRGALVGASGMIAAVCAARAVAAPVATVASSASRGRSGDLSSCVEHHFQSRDRLAEMLGQRLFAVLTQGCGIERVRFRVSMSMPLEHAIEDLRVQIRLRSPRTLLGVTLDKVQARLDDLHIQP